MGNTCYYLCDTGACACNDYKSCADVCKESSVSEEERCEHYHPWTPTEEEGK